MVSPHSLKKEGGGKTTLRFAAKNLPGGFSNTLCHYHPDPLLLLPIAAYDLRVLSQETMNTGSKRSISIVVVI